MTKIIFNPDVARRLVEAGTPRKGKSVQTFRRNIDSPQDSEDIRLARLQSGWTQNSAGIFTAQACFIVNDVPDTSFLFTVWAPVSTEDPGGTSGATRFYVVWKGRWEMVAGAGSAGAVPALSTTLEAVLKAVNLQVSLTDTQTQGVLFSQSVMKSLYVQNGVLYYESKFLNISTNQTSINVVKSVSYASS